MFGDGVTFFLVDGDRFSDDASELLLRGSRVGWVHAGQTWPGGSGSEILLILFRPVDVDGVLVREWGAQMGVSLFGRLWRFWVEVLGCKASVVEELLVDAGEQV